MKQSYRLYSPSCRQGQSLSEYGIIFGLVIVVSIAAVFALGNQNTALLDESNRQLFSKQSDGESNASRLNALLSKKTPNAVTLTLSDGSTLSLDRYPADIKDSIVTASIDGTTTQLSLALRDIGRSLLEQGKITPEEYSQFEALANQGHQMAYLQSLVIDAAKSAPSKEAYSKAQINYKGALRTPSELSLLMGSHSNSSSTRPGEAVMWSQLPTEIRAYYATLENQPHMLGIEQYQLLVGLDNLTKIKAVSEDKRLKDVLMAMTTQIYMLSQKTATVANKTADTVNGFNDITPEKFSESVNALYTHDESAGICNLGTTTDTGVHCPKS